MTPFRHSRTSDYIEGMKAEPEYSPDLAECLVQAAFVQLFPSPDRARACFPRTGKELRGDMMQIAIVAVRHALMGVSREEAIGDAQDAEKCWWSQVEESNLTRRLIEGRVNITTAEAKSKADNNAALLARMGSLKLG